MPTAVAARRATILQLLSKDGFVDVGRLHELLQCSVATVRRDLEELQREGKLRRTHGGAIGDAPGERPFTLRLGENAAEKQAVAQAAAGLVESGRGFGVGLCGGTTMQEVARALAGHHGLTIVTNAINIAMELATSDVRVIVTGGELRRETYELVGPLAEPAAAQLHLDIVFIGVDGLTVAGGLTTHNPVEARVNRMLISRAARVVVVADHSKIGRTTFAQIAPLDMAHILVTDAGADQESLAEFDRAGLRVIVA